MSTSEEGGQAFLLTMTVGTSEEEGQAFPPRTVGIYFVHMIGNDDELNILHSQTYRAVTVEGDRAVSLRFCRS